MKKAYVFLSHLISTGYYRWVSYNSNGHPCITSTLYLDGDLLNEVYTNDLGDSLFGNDGEAIIEKHCKHTNDLIAVIKRAARFGSFIFLVAPLVYFSDEIFQLNYHYIVSLISADLFLIIVRKWIKLFFFKVVKILFLKFKKEKF